MLTFEQMESLHQADAVVKMMMALYKEDRADFDRCAPSRFQYTLQQFIHTPMSGSVILFLRDHLLVGYALLVPYWSNEFGGQLVVVDELFVVPPARNTGIASSFFRYVERLKPFGAIAALLEISPSNIAARRLYESLGYSERRNRMMYRYWGR